jgi:uncharacterized protein (DUF427 family)
MNKPEPISPVPGQESVWDYPRPPRVEEFPLPIRVIFNNQVIAETTRARRVLETSHPPVYYIPRKDLNMNVLQEAVESSFCEWKGRADYYNVLVGGRRAERAAWTYPDPSPAFQTLKDHFAFYAGAMDACTVDGEIVTPQPGDFYGGWITDNIVGPFKGEPGTLFW